MTNAIPHAVKYNNRYRGPQESKKLNSTYSQARYNLKKLKAKVEYLDEIKDTILEKPKNINLVISSLVTLISEINNTTSEIINYEVMHDYE